MMDEEALFALGSVLAAMGGMLERKGICTTMELAETLGGLAVTTMEAGDQYKGRAEYIGSWAMMVKMAAEGAARAATRN